MFSGSNSLPQKQVMEWVLKRYYSYSSIIRALKSHKEDSNNNDLSLNNSLPKNNNYSIALVIGGGDSVKIHSKAIKTFLKQNKDAVVIHASSKNGIIFNEIKNDQFFCLVGNEGYRLRKFFIIKKLMVIVF